MKVRNIYVKKEDECTLLSLEGILRREGNSFSEWVRRQVKEYVRLHEPGNPQQTVTRYIECGKPYVAPGKCAYCPRDGVVTGEFRDGKKYRLCRTHAAQFKRDGRWRIE